MRVLLTGGTGFIGKALVARLLARGDGVRLLARRPKEALQALSPPGRPAVGELEAFPWAAPGPVPAPALADVDAVVHLAGESIGKWPWTAARKRAIRDSRVLGTRALVASLAAAPRKPRALVAASGVGWYGDRGEDILSEDEPVGNDFLAGVVRDWEAEIFAAERLGIRTVALRQGVVLGEGGGPLAQMRRPFALGLGAVLGSGKQYFAWVHLDDAVGAILWALDHEAMRGVYNVVAPEQVTNREFSVALAGAMRRPLLFRAPAWALRLVLGEMAGALLGSQRVSAVKLQASGFRFLKAELAAADLDRATKS